MSGRFWKTTLLCTALATASARAATIPFDNGAGNGLWGEATNWGPYTGNAAGNTRPTVADVAAISGFAVTLDSAESVDGIEGLRGPPATSLTVKPGGALSITNSINIGGNANANTMALGFDLKIDGGSVSTQRIFTNGTVGNSAGRIHVSSGTLKATNRIYLSNTNTTTAARSGFKITGGTTTIGTSGFRLWGADADDRATLEIVGNAGTFTSGGGVALAPNVGEIGEPTEVKFTFGTAAGAGALTVINSTTLTLNGNALTVDFAAITRPLVDTAYSTVLFDYNSSTLPGNFATPTFLGLQTGESAALVFDSTNRLFRLDYTLTAVPEPASVAFLASLSLMGLRRHRRS